MNDHNPDQLIKIFNLLFIERNNTCLAHSHDEPIYLPADQQQSHHRILFAHGFFASALHELSHWCIAGEERRLQVDYGYWYEPDGRNAEKQREFEQVEIKPQAIEWILTKACGRDFNISTDNLNGAAQEIAAGREQFAKNVVKQVKIYLLNGLPECADVLKQALLDYYQPNTLIDSDRFQLNELIGAQELPTKATALCSS
ncbi:MAG: elongation factor P hydroxylase [Oleispira sp.]|jgi:elongation factor P hydroxylase